MQPSFELDADTLRAATATMLQTAGLAGDFVLHQLAGGGNNRVFRVDVNGERRGVSPPVPPVRALLKAYFRHPEDRRDRLGAEFSFCAFAWENGVRSLPQPLARDLTHRLGLYEFIEGRKLLPEEVDEGAIRQALTFFADVNRHKHLPAARELPAGSEAYFKLADHLDCIDRRLKVLREIERSSAVNCEAAEFVAHQLAPAWERVRTWVEDTARPLGLSLEGEIPRDDWCLSPSDFGFHNAILTEGGRLRFLDFEYAGWDDPAKLVCDFFCQVAVTIAASYFDIMVESVAAGLTAPRQFRGRVALLMPVYRLKWCCIVLNEFVRVSSNRRRFAHVGIDPEAKKVQQLHKARWVLHSVTDERGIYGLR